jgi:hypothetical protein
VAVPRPPKPHPGWRSVATPGILKFEGKYYLYSFGLSRKLKSAIGSNLASLWSLCMINFQGHFRYMTSFFDPACWAMRKMAHRRTIVEKKRFVLARVGVNEVHSLCRYQFANFASIPS